METKTMVRWGEHADRDRAEFLLGGLTGLGTVPTDFPLTKADEVDTEAGRNYAVGIRIARRLTSGDWLDREFLMHAREWAQSIKDASLEQTEEWWLTQLPTEFVAAPREQVASDLAANSEGNARRVDQVIEYIDEMLEAIRNEPFRVVTGR